MAEYVSNKLVTCPACGRRVDLYGNVLSCSCGVRTDFRETAKIEPAAADLDKNMNVEIVDESEEAAED